MMRLLSSLLPSLLLLVGPLITPTAAVQGHLRRRGSPLGFYESHIDSRKCPSPYCGGYFVRPIDGSSMTCPGASEATAECYVAAMHYSNDVTPPPVSSDDTSGISIIYGSIVPGQYQWAPDIYDFVVHDGTTAMESQQIILDYSVQPDYRYCAAPLCGGFWLKSLATTKTLCSDGSVADACYVVSLNLSGLGLTPEEEQVVLGKVVSDGGSVQGYYIENPDYDTTNWPDLKDLFVLETSETSP